MSSMKFVAQLQRSGCTVKIQAVSDFLSVVVTKTNKRQTKINLNVFPENTNRVYLSVI